MKVAIEKSTLKDIADVVREKTGKTGEIPVLSIKDEIAGVADAAYALGDADGQIKGKAEGETIGYGNALAKRTDLVVTENGEYAPEGESTGFKSVSVEIPSDMDALIEGSITEISSGATKVKQYAFYASKSLISVSIPNATSIGEKAFYDCDALKDISLPNATSIGESCFWGCDLLESVSIPKVGSLKGSTFGSCVKLTSADFPSVTGMNTYVFQNCYALTSANFPKSTSVGTYAFYNCYELTSANFPSATSVAANAFRACNKIATLDFPKVTSIGTNAFHTCGLLTSLILRAEAVCTLENTNAFTNCYHIKGIQNAGYNQNGDKDGYIYVPANLVESYKTATNWSTYASQIVAIPGEEGTKLPTPEIMVDVGDLYINNIASATSVSIYWCYEGEETWNLLAEPTIVEGTEQEVFLSSVISGWIATNGFLPGDSVTLSVIAHADGYEDSERSNEVTFTVPYS